jgi:hypothetical protein
MIVQHRHSEHLFDARQVPLAVHARRDPLDIFRGTLPPLTPAVRQKRGPAPLAQLYITGVAQGLLVGLATGAAAGTLLFPVIGTILGAGCGVVVAAPAALLLAGAITALAAGRHRPLRNPWQFHREMWPILLVGVAILDLAAVLLAYRTFPAVPWHLASLLLAAFTALVLVLLRPAARRIVVAYAVASGWVVLVRGPA